MLTLQLERSHGDTPMAGGKALGSSAGGAAVGPGESTLFSPAASPVGHPGSLRGEGSEDGAQIGSPDSIEIGADEQQFLSFLAGLAATEHDASTGAEEDARIDYGDRVLVADRPVQLGAASSDGAPAPMATQPLPTTTQRRSARPPKPKRPQEAPGSDASAPRKKAKQQQGTKVTHAHGRLEAGQHKHEQQQQQQQQQQRKTTRIRLTISSIDAANQVPIMKRQQEGASPTPEAVPAAAVKRPRIRLSSSSVQQAYDAAAAAAAATTQSVCANEGGSDDEDNLPLFSIKNKEMESKHATPEEVMSQLTVGCTVQVKIDKGSKAWPGRVIQLDSDKLRVLVHFLGWNARYDRWIKAKASRIALVADKEKQRDEPEPAGASKGDGRLPEVTPKSTPRTVSWLDAAKPAQAVRLRTACGGFLEPHACLPRQLVSDVAGLRYDLLLGAARHQHKAGQRLLEVYQALIAPPPTDGSQDRESEVLRDGIHTPTLSVSAKTVGTLLLRVGSQLVGAATFRFLHSGGEAGERQDDSTLVLEVLGLAVVSEHAPDTSGPWETSLATFGTRLVNGLKALAWAEMVQLGGPGRRHAERQATAASVPRHATRSKGSRRCCIVARPTDDRSVAFWRVQQLRSGAAADAVASYVSRGRHQTPGDALPTPMLCTLQPDGSDAPKVPRSAAVDQAAQRELHAAVVIQKALRSLFAVRERAALEAARKKAELERQRAAEEAARQQAAADAQEIEDALEGIVRAIVAKAAAEKAKAKREAKAAVKAAALAKAKETREANAAARRVAEAQQAAELRAWQAGLAVGSWCVHDETDRAGQLTQPPDHDSGIVQLLWADTQIDSRCPLDDLRAPSLAEEAAAVSTANEIKHRIAAEKAAAAAEKARLAAAAAAEQEAQRKAAAEAAAEATRRAAEAEAARLTAEAEAARLAAAIKAGVRAIILEAGESASQMTFKGVRALLEQRLNIRAGGLEAKKAEVKAAIRQTWLDISSNQKEEASETEPAAPSPRVVEQDEHKEAEKEAKTKSEEESETQEHTKMQHATVSPALETIVDATGTQAHVPSQSSLEPNMKKSKNSKNGAAVSNASIVDHGVWHCVKKAVVRAGAALTSSKAGRLKPGDVFTALEVRAVEGQLRVRGDFGWVSVRSLGGNCLLEKR